MESPRSGLRGAHGAVFRGRSKVHVIYIYIADMHLLHRKSRNQTKKCSCYIQVTSAPCFFTFLHLGSEGADAKRLAAKQETLGSLMNPQGTRMDASENPVVHVVY